MTSPPQIQKLFTPIIKTPSLILRPKKILGQRIVTNRWQELLMLGGTLVAVLRAAAAFFYGSALLTISFLFLGAISGASAFYMRQFANLKNLQTIVDSMQSERQMLTLTAGRLENENRILSNTNKELRFTNDALAHTNETFKKTVEQLHAQNTELYDSNEKLKKIILFLESTNQKLEKTKDELMR